MVNESIKVYYFSIKNKYSECLFKKANAIRTNCSLRMRQSRIKIEWKLSVDRFLLLAGMLAFNAIIALYRTETRMKYYRRLNRAMLKILHMNEDIFIWPALKTTSKGSKFNTPYNRFRIINSGFKTVLHKEKMI